jgi:hypothetical protein
VHDLDDVLERGRIDAAQLLASVTRQLEEELDTQLGQVCREERADEIVYQDVGDDAKVEELGQEDEEVGCLFAEGVALGG